MNIAAAICVSAIVLIPQGTLTAQRRASQEVLTERLEKKLHSKFLTRASWSKDVDAARKLAHKEGKVIFGYFTRSFSP